MSKIRILLVEDEGIEGMDIKRELESFDFEVPCVAGNGKDAIRMAEQMHPDLILMDIMLPGEIDGIEVSRRLKHLEIPIVYLTALSESATFERAKFTTPYGYLIKPFDSKELKYTIELAIYKSSSEKEIKSVKNEFKLLTDNSNDMIYRMSLIDGSFEYVNPAAEKITGYSQDEFYSSRGLLKNAIHPDYREYYQQTFKNLLDGMVEHDFEYKIITKNGEEKWLNQRNNLVTVPKENPLQLKV